MSDAVIRVENLGKKYIIGHEKQERHTALCYVMANSAKSLVLNNSGHFYKYILQFL
jgi:lipopolysaccharide transport system ATP-binding protein